MAHGVYNNIRSISVYAESNRTIEHMFAFS